jgi:hypothetical protein
MLGTSLESFVDPYTATLSPPEEVAASEASD